MGNRKNQLQRGRRKGEQGFTLIELLVVIAVLAVLAAVVVFNVTGVKDKGSAAACSTDIKSVQSGYDVYLNDGGATLTPVPVAPATTASAAFDPSVLVTKYLHTTPTSCNATSWKIDQGGSITATP